MVASRDSWTSGGNEDEAHPAFVGLFHRRWTLPVLAELARLRGAKFVTLQNRLGISRESLRATLDALIEGGWVVRNPGHGHPMRPEYLLSADADAIAPACAKVTKTLIGYDALDVGFRKWSMPVVWAIHRGHHRFGDLKNAFDGVTSRALSLTLKDLPQVGLVDRVVVDGYPPATVYELTRRGRTLGPPLVKLHREVRAQFRAA